MCIKKKKKGIHFKPIKYLFFFFFLSANYFNTSSGYSSTDASNGVIPVFLALQRELRENVLTHFNVETVRAYSVNSAFNKKKIYIHI